MLSEGGRHFARCRASSDRGGAATLTCCGLNRGGLQRLREEKIEFVVAPFEADAQLAHLSRTGVCKTSQHTPVANWCVLTCFAPCELSGFLFAAGYIETAISEDSDLVAFGCRRVFYKMDQVGNGVDFQLASLQNCHEPK